jgi:hypothetical protein
MPKSLGQAINDAVVQWLTIKLQKGEAVRRGVHGPPDNTA